MPKNITKRHLQILIIINVVASLLSSVVSSVSTRFMPEAWRALVTVQENAPIDTYTLILGLIFVPFGLWGLQNLYALYHFKPYARKTFVFLTVAGLVASAAMIVEPYASYGLEDSLYALSTTINGIIIALVYYSPLAREFETPVVAAVSEEAKA
jgi:hypothetical protein